MMKKIVFEGTEDQFRNLAFLFAASDNDLPSARTDYCTTNLWSVHDVKKVMLAPLSEREKMEVLEKALASDTVVETIWEAIGLVLDNEVEPRVVKRERNSWLRFHSKYSKLTIHQRINARQQRNRLNINGLFVTTMDSIEKGFFGNNKLDECPSNQPRLYHKHGKQHSMYKH